MVHVQVPIELFFYPSALGVEMLRDEMPGGTEDRPNWEFHTYGFGVLYVVSGKSILAAYQARGGPKETFRGADGHVKSPIPPGKYTLGKPEHHVTPNWSFSSIPWGAQIRQAKNGEIQFDDGSGWKFATGSDDAPMTRAVRHENAKTKPPLTRAKINQIAIENFDVNPDEPTKVIVSVWQRNDFGEWAFRLNGGSPGFFIHTTPESELADDPNDVKLDPSHGCIHMRPVDRKDAMDLGYLRKGVVIHVMAFDAKGAPV
jgi:lipoprotein-anchoring transpeptidase ErfK/SrfK